MIKTLETSMLNISSDVRTLAPLCARHGIRALGVPTALLESEQNAAELTDVIRDYGLTWGLLPMPADFYFWGLTDEQFDVGLNELERRAAIAEKAGIHHAYNHVWSSSFRPFEENFEWHVRRVKKVTEILDRHGVHYGLEFLGPHELRRMQPHEFVHSLSGVLAIADAAGGRTGIAFDTYHWYCSANGDRGDVLYMAQHIDRLVAVHMNDAVPGRAFDEQKDMERRLPMESGIIDSRWILNRFKERDNDALFMIEPFEPGRTIFHALSAEEAIKKAADVFKVLEAEN